jgi:hypothetical protein
MSYPEMGFPVVAAATRLFDTQVFQHVRLAGPIVKFVLLMLNAFSVEVPAFQGDRKEPGRIRQGLRRGEEPRRPV